ncbi:hypothetical protein CYMTET_36222 [Cymbomonas tetramitiformis]|uniref:SUI1 domain-containing protein n=1 Tax=Cymbomonas tetramitiformis TaxID=36881 RepID=A0AAE0CII0_9CHLO|nr:hypothetical protein CYMTET_36222 [Cymbomonas tetramitiformis]
MSQMPYSIRGTKKGALPITVEKRPKGKVVTVIANVTGDSKALLHDLQLAAGTGGTAYADKIELQGNHESLAESLLRKKKCLQGVAKPAAVPSKEDVCASREPDRAKQSTSEAPADEETRATMKGHAFSHTERGGAYKRFEKLMKTWLYWDLDYSRLPELWESNPEYHEGADRSKRGGVCCDLEADYDAPDWRGGQGQPPRLSACPRPAVMSTPTGSSWLACTFVRWSATAAGFMCTFSSWLVCTFVPVGATAAGLRAPSMRAGATAAGFVHLPMPVGTGSWLACTFDTRWCHA